MKRYYANLLGNWIDITDTGTVADHQDPDIYFKENFYCKHGSNMQVCFPDGYIHIQYGEKGYLVHRSMIQIVTE